MPDSKYKRVNVLIRPDQHKRIADEGLSLSGLVRDLIDDRFSNTKIVLSLSPKSKQIYDLAISNFGASDAELESHIVDAIDKFLLERRQEIDNLRDTLKSK